MRYRILNKRYIRYQFDYRMPVLPTLTVEQMGHLFYLATYIDKGNLLKKDGVALTLDAAAGMLTIDHDDAMALLEKFIAEHIIIRKEDGYYLDPSRFSLRAYETKYEWYRSTVERGKPYARIYIDKMRQLYRNGGLEWLGAVFSWLPSLSSQTNTVSYLPSLYDMSECNPAVFSEIAECAGLSCDNTDELYANFYDAHEGNADRSPFQIQLEVNSEGEYVGEQVIVNPDFCYGGCEADRTRELYLFDEPPLVILMQV